MPQYYSQNIGENVQCHVGHFVINGGRGESTRCDHNHNKIGEDADRIFRHEEDKIHFSWVPLHIEEDDLGAFFAHYRQVNEVVRTRSKVGIAKGGVALLITLTKKSFSDIPDLFCVAARTVLLLWRAGDLLLVLWLYRSFIKVLPWQETNTTNPATYVISEALRQYKFDQTPKSLGEW